MYLTVEPGTGCSTVDIEDGFEALADAKGSVEFGASPDVDEGCGAASPGAD